MFWNLREKCEKIQLFSSIMWSKKKRSFLQKASKNLENFRISQPIFELCATFHIEASYLICSTNPMTGSCIKWVLDWKWVHTVISVYLHEFKNIFKINNIKSLTTNNLHHIETNQLICREDWLVFVWWGTLVIMGQHRNYKSQMVWKWNPQGRCFPVNFEMLFRAAFSQITRGGWLLA